jgi:hypothetical protein
VTDSFSANAAFVLHFAATLCSKAELKIYSCISPIYEFLHPSTIHPTSYQIVRLQLPQAFHRGVKRIASLIDPRKAF